MFYEPTLAPTCKICEGDECGSSCNSVGDGKNGDRKATDEFGRQTAENSGSSVSLAFVPLVLLILNRANNMDQTTHTSQQNEL